MIHASQVTKASKQHAVLTDVSFFLPTGSYTYLTGATGSGKTTLLEMIAGRQRPDSGRLVVNGINMRDTESERLAFLRRTIGYVESFPVFLENRSTAENVRLPLDIAGFARRDAGERVREVMQELGISTLADIPVQRLTDDQRWLTACARATAHKPQLFLIDQPSATISEATMQRQLTLACRHCSAGTTVLVTTGRPGDKEQALHIDLKQGRALINEHNTAVY